MRVGIDSSARITSATYTIAAGSTATLTTTGSIGAWSSSDASILTVNASTGLITGVRSGTATVTYSGNNSSGCMVKTVVTVTVTPGTNTPVIVVHNPLPVCGQGVVDITAAAITAGNASSLTYSYYTNAAGTVALVNPDKISSSGTYFIVGTNASGVRSVPAPVIVIVIAAPSLSAGFTFDSYCINSPVTFTSTSAIQGQVAYTWTDNTGRTSSATAPSFTYTQAGSVTMKLKISSLVCPLAQDSITKTITIEQPIPGIRMQPVNVIANEATTIRARNFGISYAWTPAANISLPNVYDPKVTLRTVEQEYRVAIKAASGCVTVDTVVARIFDKYIYVPNAFTPNGDGINDKLLVNIIGNGLRNLTYFRVYNRYSKLVFQTTDATTGWDGRWNGTLQPVDTYIWVAEVKDASGHVSIQRGNVSLLR